MKSLLAWTMLTGAALATDGDYAAVTNAEAALRHARNKTAQQAGVVPQGVTLVVPVCFNEGAYCFVTSAAYEGDVAGDLLTIVGDTNTVAAAEKARWDLIRKNRERLAANPFEPKNIVIWGLSYEKFGAELARLLPRSDVSMLRHSFGHNTSHPGLLVFDVTRAAIGQKP